ncbi:hypothetical protein BGZ58_006672, partial [Dissophora ornata]
TTRGDPDHTILAVSDLVSDNSNDGNCSPNPSATISSTPTTRKRKQYPGQERQLEPLGVESKRQALIAKGLSPGVTAFILGNRDTVMTQKRYQPTQQAFLDWIQEGSFELDINPAVPIVNWLHQSMATVRVSATLDTRDHGSRPMIHSP